MELPEYVGVTMLCCGLVSTNLAVAGQHRPDKFGGAFEPANVELAKKGISLGMEPNGIGRRLVEGVQRGDFYVVTHPHNREYIVGRYEEILGAFDAQAPHFEGDDRYDVRKIMAQMNE
jgi:hypothetical protein